MLLKVVARRPLGPMRPKRRALLLRRPAKARTQTSSLSSGVRPGVSLEPRPRTSPLLPLHTLPALTLISRTHCLKTCLGRSLLTGPGLRIGGLQGVRISARRTRMSPRQVTYRRLLTQFWVQNPRMITAPCLAAPGRTISGAISRMNTTRPTRGLSQAEKAPVLSRPILTVIPTIRCTRTWTLPSSASMRKRRSSTVNICVFTSVCIRLRV